MPWGSAVALRGAARQSAAMSMAGFLVNCSFAAVQLQKSRVRACDQPVRIFRDGLGISMTMKTFFTFRTE